MSPRILGKLGLIVAIGAVAILPVARAQSQTQQTLPPQGQTAAAPDSVADAARKAKADPPKAAKKVYTEDDMPALKTGGLSVVGEQPPADAPPVAGDAKPGAKPAAAPGAPTVKDEAYWRDRAKKIRDQMADVDQQISTLQDEVKKGGNGGFDMQTGRTQNVVVLEDRSAKLKSLEQKKADLQKQMDALEEEARQNDVPVGWLR
jgi:hypothetical protein